MPKCKSLTSIESKIKTVEDKVARAKERYDRLCEELSKLQKEKDHIRAEELFEAFRNSGKSYRELMTFLKK